MAEQRILQRIVKREQLAGFYDPPKFLAYCKDCHRYGAMWCCPPYGQGEVPALDRYPWCALVGVQVRFDRPTLEQTQGKAAVRQVTEQALDQVRQAWDSRLWQAEAAHPGSLALYGGSCRLCRQCTRPSQPCRHPERMRLSLESIGFDVAGMADQLLGCPMLWAGERLPAYYLLVYALLSPEPIPPDFLGKCTAK